MKLLRYGPAGREKPGLLDVSGRIRDLSGHVHDVSGEALAPASLARLAGIDAATLPIVDGSPRYGAPVQGVRKFIAIGLNFSDHAAESNMPEPREPIVFMKATSCIQGPNDSVMLPKDSLKTDWEVELGVVIGTTARYVDEADALAHVAGYLIVNDVSEREYQLERGGTWDKGKNCETFNPLGPFLVPADEIADPQSLEMRLWVNGEIKQNSSTKNMIFPIAEIVRYLSQFLVLRPGDVINTGTPAGVALGQPEPKPYLRAGDVVELEIEGLGKQRQTLGQA